MISLTYLKLVISGKKYVTKEQWDEMLESTIIPALRNMDMNADGKITAAEALRAAVRILTSCIQ